MLWFQTKQKENKQTNKAPKCKAKQPSIIPFFHGKLLRCLVCDVVPASRATLTGNPKNWKRLYFFSFLPQKSNKHILFWILKFFFFFFTWRWTQVWTTGSTMLAGSEVQPRLVAAYVGPWNTLRCESGERRVHAEQPVLHEAPLEMDFQFIRTLLYKYTV